MNTVNKYKFHIASIVVVIVYLAIDVTLATGFVVGIAVGLCLADEMDKRAKERYERRT